jgi:dual specificity phosphatase 12
MNYEVEAPEPCKQHCIEIEDDEKANLLDHLEDVLDFLDDAIDASDGKVLVHCHNGVSRSPAVVLAFMCYSMGLQLDEAVEVLRMDVPQAAPNEGFMQQLQLFVAMGCELHAHDDELIERFC